MSKQEITPPYKKKVFTAIQDNEINRTVFSSAFPTQSIPDAPLPQGKFTSTQNKKLRDSFKKTFLPLLIDVIELRQLVQNHKTKDPKDTVGKTPKEILEKLERLQGEIEESKKWCEGVILQISKGIEEAKAALNNPSIKNESPSSTKSFFKKLLRL